MSHSEINQWQLGSFLMSARWLHKPTNLSFLFQNSETNNEVSACVLAVWDRLSLKCFPQPLPGLITCQVMYCSTHGVPVLDRQQHKSCAQAAREEVVEDVRSGEEGGGIVNLATGCSSLLFQVLFTSSSSTPGNDLMSRGSMFGLVFLFFFPPFLHTSSLSFLAISLHPTPFPSLYFIPCFFPSLCTFFHSRLFWLSRGSTHLGHSCGGNREHCQHSGTFRSPTPGRSRTFRYAFQLLKGPGHVFWEPPPIPTTSLSHNRRLHS